MSKLDILLLALKNFTRRLARSVLTIIGVVIGSMAIVVMVSLGIGVQESMMKSIEQYGDLSTIQVYLWNIDSGGSTMVRSVGGGGISVSMSSPASSSSSSRKGNENPYLEALHNVESIEHVVAAMPFKNDSVRLVSGRYVNPWAQLALVDVSKLHYFNIKTAQGRMLQEGDGKFAMVMSPYTGENFVNLKSRNPYDWSKREFDENGRVIPYVDVYNDEIQMTFDDRYGEKPNYDASPRKRAVLYDIEIVGYHEEMSNYSWYNFMDINVYTELKRDYLKALMKSLPKEEADMYQWQLDELDRFTQAYVKVDDRNNVAEVVQQIRDMGYDSYSNMEWVNQVNSQMAVIQLVMGAIGAVALLVAAINIANTMIMSIYERTKEIGIMKVIGCRLGDICLLFLLEAAILGVIGGVIGIAASYGASALLNNLPPDSINMMFGFYIDPSVGGSLSSIPYWLVFAALGISVGVAVLAGLYPSIRAMRLSALEAIRNE